MQPTFPTHPQLPIIFTGLGPIMTGGALLPGQYRLLLRQEAQPGVFQRWYLTDDGDLYFTYNAAYNNATQQWSQDDATRDSWLSQVLYGSYRMKRKVAGSAAWDNASWDAVDSWFGAYSESATTREYDFGVQASVRTVGDYVGGCIPFSTEFPSAPTSLTLNFLLSSGCNVATAYTWAVTRRGVQWAIQSTAFNVIAAGTLVVGF